MAFTSTVLGAPPTATNFGPPTNFDKVSTHVGTGYSATSGTPGAIGTYQSLGLSAASVGNSQTSAVVDSYKATSRLRVVNVESSASAVTATASFLIYNATQAANVIGATTPSTTAAYTSTITTPIVEKDDILQLVVTTDGSGALTNLSVKLGIELLGSPANG